MPIAIKLKTKQAFIFRMTTTLWYHTEMLAVNKSCARLKLHHVSAF